jgi:Carboxypeptidase regulatory-like domain
MRVSVCRVLAGMVVLLAFHSDEARACSCPASGPPCAATWQVDVVVAGVVRSIETVDHSELGSPYQSTLVKFEVERAFVNGSPGPVELLTGRGGGDCGYRFVAGQRYLVYAWKHPSGRLSTGICSRTRPLEQASEDLAYLATVAQQPRGARVSGRVTHLHRDPFEKDWIDYGPFENIVVNLRGSAFSRDVSTDKNGRYEFSGLPAGKLTLTLVPPTGFDGRYLEREVEIRDARACSSHDFSLRYIARASGTVVDSSGRPLAGIMVDAVAAELAGFLPPPYQQPVKTDARGRFEFDDLPPGLYVFGVSLTRPEWTPPGYKPAGPAVFLPGTAAVRDATIVELKANDRVDVGILRLAGR